MERLTADCLRNGLKLFLGGLRQGAGEGMLRFKSRWSNRVLPAWLLKMVVRRDIYQRLAIMGNSYFPGYRVAPTQNCGC